ncbi:MAG TPA: deoxyribonuclease IV, partial [Nitrososphaerales archaeon]|nr:deoxyribonuclease IV [Nitrososphaerales archaeon]
IGVMNIAEACSEALKGSKGESMILLENMAGQKNCIGARFEELRGILDKVGDDRVGICLDACHMFAAGFDLRGKLEVAQTMGLFDELVGFDRLKVLHLNDSKGTLGSNLDRHENVGQGKIGKEGLKALVRYSGMTERPIIMETPYEDENGMAASMKAARALFR